MISWHVKLIQEVSKSEFVTDFSRKIPFRGKISIVQPSLVALEVIACKL